MYMLTSRVHRMCLRSGEAQDWSVFLEEDEMQKHHSLLVALVLLLVLLVAACSAPTAPPTITSGIPTLSSGPAVQPSPTVQSAVQPTTSGSVTQAPICQAAATCEALDAEQIPLDCVKKVPYTNVLVPTGTAFEVVDKSGNFMCIDSGMVVNGKEVLTCHGTELYAFQLKLTNSACSSASLVTGTGECQQGYGFDSAQHCCAPVSSTGTAGSTTVTINLGACPAPRP